MFFFIGGIQPRTRVLDATPQLCPNCGHLSARIQRIDRYLSLFFVPLFPVGRGDPLLACPRCGYYEPLEALPGEEPQEWFPEPRPSPKGGGLAERCPSCGGPIGTAYRYCPQCGRRL